MKVVISYKNADLDGVASAVGYSEYLNMIGEEASYYLNGSYQKEVDLLCSMFQINLSNLLDNLDNSSIIVVDTNTYWAVDFVSKDKIVEIIDHHPPSFDIFPNASIQLEDIGAVCTLIAEKFHRKNLVPSRDTAILLYYGIVSNTINFKSLNTTSRDKNMAKWLKDNCSDIDSNKIKELFKMKSMFPISHLRESMEIEEKFILDDNEWYIGQLEIVSAKEFLNKNINSIRKIMDDVKREYHTNYVFLNIVDIIEGYHIIYCPFSETKNILKRYGYSFYDDMFIEDKLVLRKDVKKELREK